MAETGYSTSDYDYELPPRLIAQTPAPVRDASRLLVLNRQDGSVEHRIFHDIITYLNPGDTLVINDSKVIPARLYGERIGKTTRTPAEVVLLRQRESDVWEAIVRPGKRLRRGDRMALAEEGVFVQIEAVLEDGNRLVRFLYDKNEYPTIYALLDKLGNMPLPPYIHEKLADKNRYQTVYAKEEGSAAAPTAGLHFTPELLGRIREKGIDIVPVMLHVGLGTFRPVKEDDVRRHKMHSEFITVTEEAAQRINATRARGGRIIAVGTTSVRTLESAADEAGIVHPVAADTSIFIYPGYRFRAVDAMITNFHLPKSTLLMLISAFADRKTVLRTYEEAVRQEYRFFSFGDAMFIQ